MRWLFALVLVGCGAKYDPKSATFYHDPNRPFPAATKQPVQVATKFEWLTRESDAAAFLDKVARRAPRAGVVSSRMQTALEISSNGVRLQMTPVGEDLRFECWATYRESCHELLARVLDAPEN